MCETIEGIIGGLRVTTSPFLGAIGSSCDGKRRELPCPGVTAHSIPCPLRISHLIPASCGPIFGAGRRSDKLASKSAARGRSGGGASHDDSGSLRSVRTGRSQSGAGMRPEVRICGSGQTC